VWEGLGRPARGRTRFKTQESALGARDRWRLAHEIAHHIMHGAQPHLRAGSWETHELEYEADLLAAELLIPDPWLARALKKAENEKQPAEIEELARTFQVGRQEMEKRLRQLDLLRGEVLGRM
jgi:Zn-dependent peptidase ImmA (M78 family)